MGPIGDAGDVWESGASEVGAWVASRTPFMDDAVLRALAAGVDQVVICGAGYDGRALRFRTPGVRFFEVDHPAAQIDKRRRLEGLGIDATDVTFVAVVFTRPGLPAALAAAGHDAGRPSTFLVEGVLRYLPEMWVRALLASLAQVAAPGSELEVTISTAEDGVVRACTHEERLAAGGELVLTLPPRDVALAWLAAAGWTVTSVLDVGDLDPLNARRGRALVLAVS